MHTVDTDSKSSYNIVECQDPFCSICTRAIDDQLGFPPSPPKEGIIVYTCSNPSCSLCDGDYSLLLDIMSPTASPSEESFMEENYIFNMSRNYEERLPAEQSSTERHKRKMSGHIGNATISKKRASSVRQHTTSVKQPASSVAQHTQGVNQHAQSVNQHTQSVNQHIPSFEQHGSSVKHPMATSKPCNDVFDDNIDEMHLMNLAFEFELDKMQRLPELHKDVITEFWE